MTIGLIGAGKVGFTLGKYFSGHGIPTAGYYSRRTDSAQQAAQFTNTRAYPDMGPLIAQCDALFLTVPDGSISSVFQEVRRHPIQGKLICHCSGAFSAREALPGVEAAGAFGYSIHPLFAVSDKYCAYEELADVFFAVEGSPARLEEVVGLLRGVGLRVQVINPACKTLYHCAAATASNLMTALTAHSVELLVQCGFSPDGALAALTPLLTGNVRHITADGLTASLTGPVERGDMGTIRRHLASLTAPEDRALYALLSRKLLPLAAARHPERSYEPIRRLLAESLGACAHDRKDASR